MSFFRKSKPKPPDRYFENSKGDFYVMDGVCTSCGAPQAEAPDLIDHSRLEYGHCYFKRQPETEEEIDQAINAIAVSCISGLRYGGTDERILRRLYEMGEGDQCDHRPTGKYKTIIWEKVTFQYGGTIQELSERVTSQIVLGPPHLNKQIINFKLENGNYFEFIYRWVDWVPGNIFRCYFTNDGKVRVELEIEEKGSPISLRSTSIILNSILRSDKNASNILWFDQDNNSYVETELR